MFYLLALFLPLFLGAAEADTDAKALRQEVEALKQLVAQMQAQLSQQGEEIARLNGGDAAPPALAVEASDHPKEILEDGPQHDSDPEYETAFDRGFWARGMNGKLRVGGVLELDAIGFLTPHIGNSNFLIRRARLFCEGEILDTFGFMLMAKWDRLRPGLHYAWIETLSPDYARLRFGLFKEPFGLEALYSDVYWDFDERSLGTENYLQLEDIGMMLFGKAFDDRIEYGLGVFNGNGNNLENNEGKELVGRLVVSPFPCQKLYLGTSASYARAAENLTGDSFVTGAQTDFWTWTGTVDSPVLLRGDVSRFGTDFEWLYRSAALRGECLFVEGGRIKSDFGRSHFRGSSWYVEGSYLLTGEEMQRNKPVIPFHNFERCGGWGALELAARYEEFRARQKLIDEGFATGTGGVRGFTLAMNWFFNPFVALKLDWQYLTFRNAIEVHNRFFHHESVVTSRLQAEF